MNEKTDILLHYKELLLKRNMLKSMLKHLLEVQKEDFIEIMNFEHDPDLPGYNNVTPNRTPYAALYYQQRYNNFYEREISDCIDKIHAVDHEISLIEAAISELPEHLRIFLDIYLQDDVTWDYIAAKMNVSRTMVAKYRKRAIKLLEEMLDFASTFLDEK